MEEYISKEDIIKIIDKNINEVCTVQEAKAMLFKIKDAIYNQEIIELPKSIGQRIYCLEDEENNVVVERMGKYYKMFSMYINGIKYYFVANIKYGGFVWSYTNKKYAIDIFEYAEKNSTGKNKEEC